MREHTSLDPGRAWREAEGGRSLCTDQEATANLRIYPLRLNLS